VQGGHRVINGIYRWQAANQYYVRSDKLMIMRRGSTSLGYDFCGASNGVVNGVCGGKLLKQHTVGRSAYVHADLAQFGMPKPERILHEPSCPESLCPSSYLTYSCPRALETSEM